MPDTKRAAPLATRPPYVSSPAQVTDITTIARRNDSLGDQLTFDTLLLDPLPLSLAAWIVVDPSTGCWLWTGRIDRDGYGRAGSIGAHRAVWLALRGPIPPGLQLDHLCHDPDICYLTVKCPHRRCVNPDHLAVCTPLVNSLRSGSFAALNARKVRCDHGHVFTEANTYRPPGRPRRDCRACVRQRVHDYQARLRERGQLARAA